MAPISVACIWCECGATYERTEMTLPIKDIGIFECTHCGVVMERWHGKNVPAFKPLAGPKRRTTAA